MFAEATTQIRDTSSFWETALQIAVAVTPGPGTGPGLIGIGAWGVNLGRASLSAAARGAGRTLCFGAGTLVHSESGLVPIEEIAVGDLVWSQDDETGEVSLKKVTQTFVTPEQLVLQLNLTDGAGMSEVLTVTGEHPFYTKRGWIEAKDLSDDDRILRRSGGWLKLTGATWAQDITTVYNFEVEDTHTYFVGSAGALVHNNCGVFQWMVDGGGILGEVNAEGVLTFAIEAGPASAVRGTQLFNAMMSKLGPSTTAIQGYWRYGTNLATVNKLTAGGAASLEQAVTQTWTASRAAMHGYVNAAVQFAEGSPGAYTRIQVLFTP